MISMNTISHIVDVKRFTCWSLHGGCKISNWKLNWTRVGKCKDFKDVSKNHSWQYFGNRHSLDIDIVNMSLH